METGIVKWFSLDKGYGFIKLDSGEQDAFVHITELKNSGINNLQEGQKVSFELTERNGKTSATGLSIVD